MKTFSFPAKIITNVSQSDILSGNIMNVKNMILAKINQIQLIEKKVNSLSQEQQIQKAVEYLDIVSKLNFSISGYDEEPHPLWDFPEIQKWAWAWIEQQSFCLLFLEPQESLLLATLCLGGRQNKKYHGYIADFSSPKNDKFQELYIASFPEFKAQYHRHWLLMEYVSCQYVYIKEQFLLMREQ